MKAEQQISFLADLLNLIRELDTLVKDYCRYLTTDQDGSCLEKNYNIAMLDVLFDRTRKKECWGKSGYCILTWW